MRLLLLIGFLWRPGERWLFGHYPDLKLSVLDFKRPSSGVRLSFEVLKLTFKALPIYGKYDIVLSWGLANMLPLALANSFLHRHSPKFVAIDVSANRFGSRWSSIFRTALRSINAIICFTTAQKSWWMRSVGYPRATFIHFAREVGVDQVGGTHTCKPEDDYIFSGGFTARDYRTLLRAAAELDERVLLVVGRDPVTGKTGLEQVVLSKNIEVRVNIPHSQFLELMSKAKLVALIMLDVPYAAGQMVLLDAMHMGKPIIVTRTSGTIDYVEDGKTALLTEPGNVTELKEKILLLSKNSQLRRTLGRNAKAKWRRDFTFEAMQQKVYGVIASVLSEPSVSIEGSKVHPHD